MKGNNGCMYTYTSQGNVKWDLDQKYSSFYWNFMFVFDN